MRMTDKLIGHNVSDEVRFCFCFSRRDGKESGAPIVQRKLPALYVGETQWINASLFEIGDAFEREKGKERCEKQLKAATIHA